MSTAFTKLLAAAGLPNTLVVQEQVYREVLPRILAVGRDAGVDLAVRRRVTPEVVFDLVDGWLRQPEGYTADRPQPGPDTEYYDYKLQGFTKGPTRTPWSTVGMLHVGSADYAAALAAWVDLGHRLLAQFVAGAVTGRLRWGEYQRPGWTNPDTGSTEPETSWITSGGVMYVGLNRGFALQAIPGKTSPPIPEGSVRANAVRAAPKVVRGSRAPWIAREVDLSLPGAPPADDRRRHRVGVDSASR